MRRFQIRLDVTESEAKELVSALRSFAIGGGATLGDIVAQALRNGGDPEAGWNLVEYRSAASQALEAERIEPADENSSPPV